MCQLFQDNTTTANRQLKDKNTNLNFVILQKY